MRLIRQVPVALNGASLFALRHLVGSGAPVSPFALATWVQRLVDRELANLGLPIAGRAR